MNGANVQSNYEITVIYLRYAVFPYENYSLRISITPITRHAHFSMRSIESKRKPTKSPRYMRGNFAIDGKYRACEQHVLFGKKF